MLCELEARGIHVFVQGAGFGSLWPGTQILWYNARRIMVSESDVPLAKAALAPFTHPVNPIAPYQWPGLLHVLRMLVEIVLISWCVPGSRRQRNPQRHATLPTHARQ